MACTCVHEVMTNIVQNLDFKAWSENARSVHLHALCWKRMKKGSERPKGSSKYFSARRIFRNFLAYDHGGHLKKCRRPSAVKVPRRVLWKVPALNGVLRKVPKSVSGFHALVEAIAARAPGALFSPLSSAPHLGPTLAEALFLALFLPTVL